MTATAAAAAVAAAVATATGTGGFFYLMRNEMNNMLCAFYCRKHACRNALFIIAFARRTSRKTAIFYHSQIIHFLNVNFEMK